MSVQKTVATIRRSQLRREKAEVSYYKPCVYSLLWFSTSAASTITLIYFVQCDSGSEVTSYTFPLRAVSWIGIAVSHPYNTPSRFGFHEHNHRGPPHRPRLPFFLGIRDPQPQYQRQQACAQ